MAYKVTSENLLVVIENSDLLPIPYHRAGVKGDLVGIETRTPTGIGALLLAAVMEMDGDLEAFSQFLSDFQQVRVQQYQDSIGDQYVVYFPKIKWDAEWQETFRKPGSRGRR